MCDFCVGMATDKSVCINNHHNQSKSVSSVLSKLNTSVNGCTCYNNAVKFIPSHRLWCF